MPKPITEPNIVIVPYLNIPEANSLAFSINNESLLPTIFNRKSDEFENVFNRKITQKIKLYDIIKTQIHTSYNGINIKMVYEKTGIEHSIIAQKVIDNKIKQAYDCKISNLGNGEIAVYFTEGNIYDYENDNVLDNYALNGFLPEFGKIGNWIYLSEYGWLFIEEIRFIQSLGGLCLVFMEDFVALEEDIAYSVFRRQDYDVYEFELPQNNFVENEYFDLFVEIDIEQIDEYAQPKYITYFSENIFVDNDMSDCLEVVYFNEGVKSNIYYNTGTFGLLNLPFYEVTELSDLDISNSKTETEVTTIGTSNFHKINIVFEGVNLLILRKLIQATTHTEIYINRLKYSVSKTIEAKRIGETNFYDVNLDLYYNEPYYNPLTERNYCGDRLVSSVVGFPYSLPFNLQ